MASGTFAVASIMTVALGEKSIIIRSQVATERDLGISSGLGNGRVEYSLCGFTFIKYNITGIKGLRCCLRNILFI